MLVVVAVDHTTPHQIPIILPITDQEVVLVAEEREDGTHLVQLQMLTEKMDN